ncbi:MAG TPA: TrkH family potassium uptake protein [Burkholderiaceae bacterium]|nr:TrkH family potassium uptake protein [Burkholderiaceae bacterium]
MRGRNRLAPLVARRVQARVRRLTPPQALILSFVGLAAVGALLLKLPAATQVPTSWMQALFTAVSAATITGLSVVDVGSQFTLFGQAVLLMLIQLGGLGLLTFGIFFIHLSRGRLRLRDRAALRDAFNQTGRGDLGQLLRTMIGFVAVMELLGTALLALQWVPQLGWGRGLYTSLFHAISAFNNAGFALEPNSLAAYAGNPLVNSVISLLFIAGGIGFVVVSDLHGKKRFADLSLHTKLMLVGTLVINLVAMLVLLSLEYGNPATIGGLHGWGAKLWATWFQAVTPRSAGMSTVDIGHLLPSSALFMMVLMFIGAGSGSTGGGIKLSTFIILLVATRAFMQQRQQPVVFGRGIDAATVQKALAVTIIAMLCAIFATFVLLLTEDGNFLDLAFEVVSALSTVGLSRDVTPTLSVAGQSVIMLLMLLGRVGPLTLAFVIANPHGAAIRYPAGQVAIG